MWCSLLSTVGVLVRKALQVRLECASFIRKVYKNGLEFEVGHGWRRSSKKSKQNRFSWDGSPRIKKKGKYLDCITQACCCANTTGAYIVFSCENLQGCYAIWKVRAHPVVRIGLTNGLEICTVWIWQRFQCLKPRFRDLWWWSRRFVILILTWSNLLLGPLTGRSWLVLAWVRSVYKHNQVVAQNKEVQGEIVQVTADAFWRWDNKLLENFNEKNANWQKVWAVPAPFHAICYIDKAWYLPGEDILEIKNVELAKQD